MLPQAPLDLGDLSEPQPDVAVYTGLPADYMEQKPTHALLVVEVSDSSLRLDRGKKPVSTLKQASRITGL